MLKWFAVGLVLYGVVVLVLYATQEKQIFNTLAISTPKTFSCDTCEAISLEVTPQVQLHGKRRPSPQKDFPLLLYFGGNADDATRIVLHADTWPVEVVVFNYRGYVDSEGTPTQAALFGDALAIYDHYAHHRPVVIMGRSLGTGVATYVAAHRKVAQVILITPYDSIRSLAREKFPFFPINWLIKHPFESIQYMPYVQAPVAILEVKDDNVIPAKHLEALKAKVPNLMSHDVLENTTHGEVLQHPDFEKTIQSILHRLLSS
jgi:pimeloyl-ACP methyl ester carboxylesterase